MTTMMINGDALEYAKFRESFLGKTCDWFKNVFFPQKKENLLKKTERKRFLRKRVDIVEFHEKMFPSGEINKWQSIVTVRNDKGNIFDVYDGEIMYLFSKEEGTFFPYINETC